jgi:hypothetical protein
MTYAPFRRAITLQTLLPLILALILALILTVPAHASGGKADKEVADPSVKLASVAIPVFEGRNVVNYLFLSIKVNLTAKADQGKLRDKEPYFRAVLVKAAHKTSFALAGHDDKLDEARFKSAMMIEFAKVAGPGMIESVEILSQSPKTRH